MVNAEYPILKVVSMSLFRKIFIVISIIIIIIQLITTSLMIGNQREALIIESDYNMTANMSIVMSQFEQAVQDMTSLGMSFSNNEALLAYFQSLDLNDEELVNDALNVIKVIKDSSELFNNVVLVPQGGVVRLDAKGAFLKDGTDDHAKEFYQVLSANPDQKSFIEKPKAGAANNAPIFSIAAQMENDGSYVGVLGLPINLHTFMNEVVIPDITDQEIKVLLVDGAGVIVWSSYEEQIFNDEYNLLKQEPSFFETIKTMKIGTAETELMGVDAQIKFDYYELFDAYVIIYKDITPYKNNLFYSIISTLILSLIILFISSIAVYMILHRITDPINQLVGYSESLASQDFDIQIPIEITDRKDEIGQLGRTYQSMVDSLNNSFVEIRSFGEKYRFLANHDELTDLPNRRNFNQLVKANLKAGIHGSIVMMDIDNFKTVNDTLGHIAGDEVLTIVADALRVLSNEKIIVSRFGGDEFIVFVEDGQDKTLTKQFIERLFHYFSHPLTISNKKTDVKFSVGISCFPEDGSNLDQLIRFADIALYTAKNDGKNRMDFFHESMEKTVVHKVAIEEELKIALKTDGFKLLYQPQVSLTTGKVIAYEALLRLKNSKYYPNEFIEVAEESFQIIDIGRWVVKEVIEQVARWQKEGLEPCKVSFNFSGEQLKDIGFTDFLKENLEKNNVQGAQLELEVTENVLIQQGETVCHFFEELIQLGIDLSIDDFGTGYSSLNYMVSFPVKKIKLDRSLNEKYLHHEGEATIGHLISLIHSLGFEIVAEGIEQWEDVSNLMVVKCDYVQGFYFSKPLDVDKVAQNLSQQYGLPNVNE